MRRKSTSLAPNMTCPVCHTPFHVKPSHRDKRVYCSKPCRLVGMAQGSTVCGTCGTPFKTSDPRRKFCSPPCAYAYLKRDMADRFWEKVDRSGGADSCWPWRAKRDKHGYGKFGTVGKHQTHASRVAWELTHGPLPHELHVCHACDNPPCCNPAHLFVGSRRDNMADAVQKGRIGHGERMPQSLLTDTLVQDIRRRVAAGEVQLRIAEEFGVAPSTINNVVSRKTWRHVP